MSQATIPCQERTPAVYATPGWGRSLLAGAGAGMAAGLAAAGVEALLQSSLPPRLPTLWSGFAAGILGGLLYGLLGRVTRRPGLWLLVAALGLATADSLLVGLFPLPAGRGPRLVIPIVGLEVPVRQLLAFAGIGRLGAYRLPGWSLPVYTVVHYTVAAVVSLLVPWWAKPSLPRVKD